MLTVSPYLSVQRQRLGVACWGMDFLSGLFRLCVSSLSWLIVIDMAEPDWGYSGFTALSEFRTQHWLIGGSFGNFHLSCLGTWHTSHILVLCDWLYDLPWPCGYQNIKLFKALNSCSWILKLGHSITELLQKSPWPTKVEHVYSKVPTAPSHDFSRPVPRQLDFVCPVRFLSTRFSSLRIL